MSLETIFIVGASSIILLVLAWSLLAAAGFPVPQMSDEWYWEGELDE